MNPYRWEVRAYANPWAEDDWPGQYCVESNKVPARFVLRGSAVRYALRRTMRADGFVMYRVTRVA